MLFLQKVTCCHLSLLFLTKMWFFYILTIRVFLSTVPCNAIIIPNTPVLTSEYKTHKYVVSIRVHNIHICAGTLISHTHVLTAASCCYDPETICLINREDYDIVASDRLINPCHTYVEKVKEVVIHENFNYNLLANNIALFKMKGMLPFYAHATANRHSIEDNTNIIKICAYYGWSFNETLGDQLQVVKSRFLSMEDCIRILHRPMVGENCTKQGITKGDIGGPLMCGSTLCGVSALRFGPTKGNKTYRVFVNLYYHKVWLDKIEKADLKESSCCRNSERLVILCLIFSIVRYVANIM